jgi:phage portal protein BeeE
MPAPPIPATKASATRPLFALHHTGAPIWSPRDYAAFAREGYAKNPIVYRAVRMVSEAAASIPIRLHEGQRRLDAHPLLDLLAQPNATACGPDLLEDWYGYLLIAGNAYMEAVSVGGAVRELHVLRPDRMKVIAGGDGWPDAYDYTANGASVRFAQAPDDGLRPILHMALFNPSNDYYGMSPIEAASSAVDLHNAASGWNKALLDNAARPSGALVYSSADGHLTEEQFARLKTELETNYQGAMNAGRPLLLEGGLDWKPMPKLRVKRLPRRYRSVLTSVAMSVSMSGVVSFIITAKTAGLCEDMPGVWLAAWKLSCAIAVPARFVVAPLVTRFIGLLVDPPAEYRG